jgi:hypothetical protein
MRVGQIGHVWAIGGVILLGRASPDLCVAGANSKSTQALETGENVLYFVIPSEARNWGCPLE